jgi:hypothetical protein
VTDSADANNPNLTITDLCAFDIVTITDDNRIVCTRIGYGNAREFLLNVSYSDDAKEQNLDWEDNGGGENSGSNWDDNTGGGTEVEEDSGEGANDSEGA